MKILHVGPISSTEKATGPYHSVRALALAQAKLENEIGILFSSPSDMDAETENSDICFLEGPRRHHYNPWFVRKDVLNRIRLKFGIPDLVIFHTFYAPFQCALARRCTQQGWPYVITPRGELTPHAQDIKGFKKRVANSLCFRSYIKSAAAIHALSAREALEIDELFRPRELIIAPNGVDEYLIEASENLSPIDLGNFRTGTEIVLGFIGRIYVYHKGLDMLINGISDLEKQDGKSKFKLLLVGPFHSQKDEQLLMGMVESLGLKQKVLYVGPRYEEEKLRHFLSSDVFVHTSRFEGMPVAVLEAMAMKRPCMVTPGTNMADIVVNGGGWKCNPTSESIASVLKEIYRDRNSLKERGERAHLLVRTKYSWKNIAKQLHCDYKKMINGARQ